MIRYVVVAVGSTEEPAAPEDLDVVQMVVDATGFRATIISERASKVLTAALIQERLGLAAS